MTRLETVRPYVIKSTIADDASLDAQLGNFGMDCCLKLVESTENLCRTIFPIGSKYFLVTWCFFDAAVVLCLAMRNKLESDDRHLDSAILGAIGISIKRLRELALLYRTALLSHDILVRLARVIPMFKDERTIVDSSDCLPKAPSPTQSSLDARSADTPVPIFTDGMQQSVHDPGILMQHAAGHRTRDVQHYAATELFDLPEADLNRLDNRWT